jgi:membrane associated rhomboid family serine protease
MYPIGDETQTPRPSIVNWAIILACCCVFAYQSSLSELEQRALIRDWGLVPSAVLGAPAGQAFRLVSHAFLHANLLHLGGNMLFLWVFGRAVEKELTHVGYLLFYLVGGVLAGAASIAVSPGSDIPGIGASGAISAVLAAYLVLHPTTAIRVFVVPLAPFSLLLQQRLPIFDVPAWITVLVWFGMQVAGGFESLLSPSGVDYAAHVGGFAAGYLGVRALRLVGLWPDDVDPSQAPAETRRARGAYVAARRMLRAGMTLEREDLSWVQQQHEYVDDAAVPAARLHELVGRRLARDRYPLEAVLWSDVEESPGTSPAPAAAGQSG